MCKIFCNNRFNRFIIGVYMFENIQRNLYFDNIQNYYNEMSLSPNGLRDYI